jgi:hypothetical protein
MKIIIDGQVKLKKPPTSILESFGNLYISTKSPRIFYIPQNSRKLKSILFSSQVMSMAGSESSLFCSCADGMVYGLSDKHKVSFKSATDKSECTYSMVDERTSDIVISKNSNKIVVLAQNTILKNTYYIYDTPVIYFDISKERQIAAVTQNNKNIKLLQSDFKDYKILNVQEGFPEIAKFVRNDLLVGTLSNSIQLYSTKKSKMILSTKLSAGVQSIYIVDDYVYLVGLLNSRVCLVHHIDNSLKIIDEIEVEGIPIGFTRYKNQIAVAISREPRLGRWGHRKDGKNKVIFLNVER